MAAPTSEWQKKENVYSGQTGSSYLRIAKMGEIFTEGELFVTNGRFEFTWGKLAAPEWQKGENVSHGPCEWNTHVHKTTSEGWQPMYLNAQRKNARIKQK